jgi:oxygen-independent coproporphyrinogen III oxidase
LVMSGYGAAHSLYIHIPFCARKCVYCDFYSIPYDESLAHSYVTSLIGELELVKEDAGELKTVYLGGGTPTTVSTLALIRLLRKIRELFVIASDAEISIEANPGTITRESVEALVGAGISRMSIGLQSFDDNELKALGRIYDVQEALKAVAVARIGGIANLGIDLMYGLPGQTLERWSEHVSKATEIYPEHISAYELTLEKGTPLWKAASKGDVRKPDEDAIVSMYDLTVDRLTEAGYRHYEISNFARRGFDCRHNLNYWNRGDYLGVGAGAHSFISRRRRKNVSDVEKYISMLKRTTLPVEDETVISPEDALRELIFLGLRKTEGIGIETAKSQFGVDLQALSTPLVVDGFLDIEHGRIRLTRKGITVSNSIISSILASIEGENA